MADVMLPSPVLEIPVLHIFSCAALALPCVLVGETPPADNGAAGADRERLQGTWKVVAIEKDGRRLPKSDKDFPKDGRLVFAGDKMVAKDGDEILAEYRYRLDPSKRPRAIDSIGLTGANKGKVHRGIYELDGDTLRLCGSDDPKERPNAFTAAAGSGRGVIILRRQKR